LGGHDRLAQVNVKPASNIAWGLRMIDYGTNFATNAEALGAELVSLTV
jgi:hypothetical protein